MEEYSMSGQSGFSRTAHNLAKAGAYFTPCEMARRIGYLFKFPDGDQVSNVLEPSCGDYSAMRTLLTAAGAIKNVTTFGVELNADSADIARDTIDNGLIFQGDFLKDVTFTPRMWQFAGINPPYGMDDENKNRLETLFMEETYKYLQKGGIYVSIIPYYVLTDWKLYLKRYLSKFLPVCVYRFPEDEYERFKQVVIIGKKREAEKIDSASSVVFQKNSEPTLMEEFSEFIESINELQKLPVLPETPPEDKIVVPSAPDCGKQIVLAGKAFDFESAVLGLERNNIHFRYARSKITQKPYKNIKIGRPVTDLSPSFMYLSASCIGQGHIAKDTPKHHIMRGGCRISTTKTTRPSADGGIEAVETQCQKVEIQIIDGLGNHTVLA